MRKLKVNDEVIVIKGKSKGKVGRVLKFVDAKQGFKVVIEGVNIVSKCKRPDPNKQEEGGIVTKEAPIQVANVAIYNPSTLKADRVGIKTVDNEKKRFFKSNNELIDIL
jgi:large subunit ribosomal protein L24